MSQPKSVIDPLNPGPDPEFAPANKGFQTGGGKANAGKGMKSPMPKGKEMGSIRPPKAGKMKMPSFKSKSIKGSGM